MRIAVALLTDQTTVVHHGVSSVPAGGAGSAVGNVGKSASALRAGVIDAMQSLTTPTIGAVALGRRSHYRAVARAVPAAVHGTERVVAGVAIHTKVSVFANARSVPVYALVALAVSRADDWCLSLLPIAVFGVGAGARCAITSKVAADTLVARRSLPMIVAAPARNRRCWTLKARQTQHDLGGVLRAVPTVDAAMMTITITTSVLVTSATNDLCARNSVTTLVLAAHSAGGRRITTFRAVAARCVVHLALLSLEVRTTSAVVW
jgi:hypothetical protein